MTRDDIPAVIHTELRSLFAVVDAIEAEAREVRRNADEVTKRHRRVFYVLNLTAVFVTSQRIGLVLMGVALAVHVASFVWWHREVRRAQAIDARVRSLWPRIMPLCMALDAVAPTPRRKTPETS